MAASSRALAAGEVGLGDVTSVKQDAASVTLTIGGDQLLVRVCDPRTVRVDYLRGGVADPSTPLLDAAMKFAAFAAPKIEVADDRIVLATEQLKATITRHPCRLSITDAAGKSVLAEPASGGVYVTADPVDGGLRFSHADGQKFYGVHAFDIGGSEHNPAAQTLLRGDDTEAGKTYQANASQQGGAGGPFIWTTAGYGLLVDSDNGYFRRSKTDLQFHYGQPGDDSNNRRYARPHDLTYFVMVGQPKDIFGELATLTGHAPMSPKWAMGFTNSQWGCTQDELISIIDTYRAKDIPIDNFTLDFDWKAWGDDNYGDFRWNRKKFPAATMPATATPSDDQPLIEKMNARGMRMTGIMKPRIIRYRTADGSGPPTQQGKDATDQQLWYEGAEWHNDYWSHDVCGELDFSKPAARDWFWANTRDRGAMQAGISGFWNDEADETSLNRRHILFNNFQFLHMEQALYDGQRALPGGQRVWSINRNFYLGAQRFAYGLWSGDINSGFGSMARQPLRMLSAISLGEMKWGMDSGGFNGTPTPENYARWIQFASLVPICRVHGTFHEHRQPWVYGPVAEEAAKAALRWRYAFAPYIYAAERADYECGVGLVRPLAMEFPDDPASADVTDEWMFGDSLLAAPVLTELKGDKPTRQIYLPPGTWIDYARGNTIEGGKTIDYALNADSWFDVPLFVRAGAILTTQAPVPSLGAFAVKDINVDVFPGPGESSATVYDDDGVTYAAEGDAYFKQQITSRSTGDSTTITLHARQGSFVPATPFLFIRLHGRAVGSVTVNGREVKRADDGSQLVTWSNGRDVYGDFTRIRLPAAQTTDITVQLTGNAPTGETTETLEAEEGSLSGLTPDTRPQTDKNHAGFSGAGFVSALGRYGDADTLYVKRHIAGTYAATVRISNGGKPQTLGVYVNGVRYKTFTAPATSNWDTWADVPFDLALAAGNNVLSIRHDPQDTGGINLDCVRIPFDPK